MTARVLPCRPIRKGISIGGVGNVRIPLAGGERVAQRDDEKIAHPDVLGRGSGVPGCVGHFQHNVVVPSAAKLCETAQPPSVALSIVHSYVAIAENPGLDAQPLKSTCQLVGLIAAAVVKYGMTFVPFGSVPNRSGMLHTKLGVGP